MIIKFKSIIKGQGEPKTIQFNAPVKISKNNKYDVYEFIEPENKVANMIEICDESINIFASTMSINVAKNQILKNEFIYPNGQKAYINIELIKMKRSKNYEFFNYTMKTTEGSLMGDFSIELTIVEK